MSGRVTVAFACNDDHGEFIGRTEAVNFVSEEHGSVDLCCQMPRGQVIRMEPEMNDGLRVGRRLFRARGLSRWYGNMAWDAATMALPEAERLLRYLLDCGYTVEGYDCGGSFAAIIEAHKRPETVAARGKPAASDGREEPCACGAVTLAWFTGTHTTITTEGSTDHTREKCGEAR